MNLAKPLSAIAAVALLAGCGSAAAPSSSPAAAASSTVGAVSTAASPAASAAASAARPSASAAASAKPGGSAAAKPAASGSAAAKPSSSTPAASGPEHIKIGFTSKSTGGMYMYLAKDLGIFQKHGLDAEIVIGQSSALDPALMQGDLDFVATIPTVVQGAEQGLPLRAILVARDHPEYLLIGDTGYSTVDSIKGKDIVGSQPTQSPTQMLNQLLMQDGLKPSDYNVIPVQDDTARAALLEQHRVQAGIVGLAQSFPLMDKGDPLIDSTLEKVFNPSNGLGTSIKIMQTRKDMVQRAVDSVLEAVQVVQTDKSRTTQVLEQEFQQTPDNAARLFDLLKNTYAKNGRADPRGTTLQLQLDAQAMQLPQPKKESDVYDWSFLPGGGQG
ncbi:MAG: ABC transporter substrate-binding protein [Chloroflexi bacterium]|nr:ABC transporter substrate-binding protein [Chloroflexota bacterium]